MRGSLSAPPRRVDTVYPTTVRKRAAGSVASRATVYTRGGAASDESAPFCVRKLHFSSFLCVLNLLVVEFLHV